MADFTPTTTRPGGQITGYKGSQAGKAQAEDRTYRNQIGIGERGAYNTFRGSRVDDESTAKEYLESKKKKMTAPPGEKKPGLTNLAPK